MAKRSGFMTDSMVNYDKAAIATTFRWIKNNELQALAKKTNTICHTPKYRFLNAHHFKRVLAKANT